MFGPLGHVGSGLAYFATARRQHESDLLTARQLAATMKLPRGLEVTWLGTAAFRFSYEGTVRWIDPADAVLVGHTHFDHALDVPAIARAHGCPVYGSRSLAHLMGLHGLAPQAVEVEPHRDYE